VESRHAADVVVHFVDEAVGEHVYSVFSEQDGLPRVIEWVGPGSRASARGVRMRITNLRLDDADSGKLFDIAAPDDFRWLSGSKR